MKHGVIPGTRNEHGWVCDCSKQVQQRLPCRHVVHWLRHLGEPVYQGKYFAPRWNREHSIERCIPDQQERLLQETRPGALPPAHDADIAGSSDSDDDRGDAGQGAATATASASTSHARRDGVTVVAPRPTTASSTSRHADVGAPAAPTPIPAATTAPALALAAARAPAVAHAAVVASALHATHRMGIAPPAHLQRTDDTQSSGSEEDGAADVRSASDNASDQASYAGAMDHNASEEEGNDGVAAAASALDTQALQRRQEHAQSKFDEHAALHLELDNALRGSTREQRANLRALLLQTQHVFQRKGLWPLAPSATPAATSAPPAATSAPPAATWSLHLTDVPLNSLSLDTGGARRDAGRPQEQRYRSAVEPTRRKSGRQRKPSSQQRRCKFCKRDDCHNSANCRKRQKIGTKVTAEDLRLAAMANVQAYENLEPQLRALDSGLRGMPSLNSTQERLQWTHHVVVLGAFHRTGAPEDPLLLLQLLGDGGDSQHTIVRSLAVVTAWAPARNSGKSLLLAPSAMDNARLPSATTGGHAAHDEELSQGALRGSEFLGSDASWWGGAAAATPAAAAATPMSRGQKRAARTEEEEEDDDEDDDTDKHWQKRRRD